MAVTSMANSGILSGQKYRDMSAVTGAPPFACEYLVIAGGGGGGLDGNQNGGGGAGGYRTNVSGASSGGGASAEPALNVLAGTYTVTVGAGGAVTTTGANSVFASFTSLGGGRGSVSPASGGSGGGAGRPFSPAGSTNGGAGTTGQGYNGGLGRNDTVSYTVGGGGGGAGAAGTDGGTNGVGGSGGTGVASSITGSSVTRGGGGAGQGNVGNGTGGAGGGGNAGVAGTVNTGGGGGAGAGAGGSGLVIFSLPIQAIATFSAGVTQTSAIVGDKRVYTVTATSTTNETVTIS